MKRRELLTWTATIVTIVILPAHAQTSAIPWEDCDDFPYLVWCEGSAWVKDENGEYICDHPLCVEARK